MSPVFDSRTDELSLIGPFALGKANCHLHAEKFKDFISDIWENFIQDITKILIATFPKRI